MRGKPIRDGYTYRLPSDTSLNAANQKYRRRVGLFFFALGTLGIGVPLLPTVPFWILAAIFFARSDPTLQRKIYEHPQFGTTVQQFVEQRVLSRRAKLFSIGGAGLGTALGLWLTSPPGYVIVTVALTMVGVFAWLATRPESVPSEPNR